MEEENTKQELQAFKNRKEFLVCWSNGKSEEAERHPLVGGTCVHEKKGRDWVINEESRASERKSQWPNSPRERLLRG
jgi:hypothetical protein